MLKKTGTYKSLMLIGGTSEIGLATVRELASRSKPEKIILAGRPSRTLTETITTLKEEYPGTNLEFVEMDLTSTGDLSDKTDRALRENQTDLVILAAGILSPEPARKEDTVRTVQVNYLGPVEVCSQVIENFKNNGLGTLVILSSVAAVRPRSDNYLYGSTKSGLDFWARGAAETLRGTNIHLLVVRPGMVETKMTHGLGKAPLTCKPEDVAKAILRGLEKKSTTVWVPARIKALMIVLSILPGFVYRRLKVRKEQTHTQ